MLFNSLKAHASRHALLALAVCTLMPTASIAQGYAPVFTPASGWEVNAGQLSNVRGLKPMKLPCVLSTEYDNGFVVRFSGGGNKLLALAIDFRQDVFKQGRQYDAMLSIGPGYVKQTKASAFTGSTLIFNLRPIEGFYNAAQNGGDMEIEIEGNKLKFSLGRIGAMFPQLEACYMGAETPPVQPLGTTQMAGKAPVAAVEKQPVSMASNNAPQPLLAEDIKAKPLPRSFKDIVQNSDKEKTQPDAAGRTADVNSRAPITAMPSQAGRVSRAVSEPVYANVPVPAAPAATGATWEAKAGDDLKIVLSRWAERAGYDLDWQSTQDGKVAQDLKLTGSFEDAVSQLLAENSAATGIGAHVETAQGGRKDLGRAGTVSTVSAYVPAAPRAAAPTGARWSAAPGANIQTTLDQWSSQAGVAIVWQSYMDFAVKQPLNVSGSYEQAVQSLLDQFNNDSRRPVGQLNTDPATGAKTLLMDIGN